MARSKYKLTGCARFFILLIIIIPIAYIAASYINGQDGIENIKTLFRGELPANLGGQQGDAEDATVDKEQQQKQSGDEEITLKELQKENQSLEEALKEARDSIRDLRQQATDSL